MAKDIDLICIATYPDKVSGEVAMGALKVRGIRAFVSADDAGGLNPGLLWGTGGAKLWVCKKDAKKAIEVISAH